MEKEAKLDSADGKILSNDELFELRGLIFKRFGKICFIIKNILTWREKKEINFLPRHHVSRDEDVLAAGAKVLHPAAGRVVVLKGEALPRPSWVELYSKAAKSR